MASASLASVPSALFSTSKSNDTSKNIVVAGTYQSFDGALRKVLLRPVKGQGDHCEDDDTRFWASSDTWVTPTSLYRAQRNRSGSDLAPSAHARAARLSSFRRPGLDTRTTKVNKAVHFLRRVEAALSDDDLGLFQRILGAHAQDASAEAGLACERGLVALFSRNHPELLIPLADFTRDL
jgi:hypothetical protein